MAVPAQGVAVQPFDFNVARGRLTAQTAAIASLVAFTPSVDATFVIAAEVEVTAATTNSFTMTVAYTDPAGNARTLTLTFSQLTGTLLTAITNVTGVGVYEGVLLCIRAKGGSAITVATTGTFTSVTYNAEASILQISAA